MKVYISGPISGMPNGNRDRFAFVAWNLKQEGHEPVNPQEIKADHEGPCIGRELDHPSPHRYGCFLRKDVEVLMYCDAIYLLPDWWKSPGATLECAVAKALGLQVMHP